jgi:hypothetical protein
VVRAGELLEVLEHVRRVVHAVKAQVTANHRSIRSVPLIKIDLVARVASLMLRVKVVVTNPPKSHQIQLRAKLYLHQ